ncbi:fatty acid desaturase-domain-containing protein [Dipodascopsis uninucleata]
MSTTTTTQKTLLVKDTFDRDFEPPNFTMKDILDAIPKRCFERSLGHSLLYAARDFIYAGVLMYAASYIKFVPFPIARFVLWTIYVIAQGIICTGLWILAHECGHGAFSPYKLANDICGWIMHSMLLVPYHSWRISHSKHHKATGHLTRDMVFVPRDRESYLKSRNLSELAEEAPIVTLFNLFIQQAFGWPAYLAYNVTGQKYPGVSPLKLNHFWPTAPMFDPKDFWDIIISDVGIACAVLALRQIVIAYGWGAFTLYYFLPYLGVNHWLVFITYLQHTDPALPHYTANEWNFARGAAATVDRDFGFIGTHFFHSIIETHVAHHYVSRIPFYRAAEATDAIKKVMGKHYCHDSTNMFYALWRTARVCQFVEGGDVKMYRNANGIGAAPLKKTN